MSNQTGQHPREARVSCSFSLVILITIVLVVLRVTGVLVLPWWLVFAPLVLTFSIALAIAAVGLVVALIVAAFAAGKNTK